MSDPAASARQAPPVRTPAEVRAEYAPLLREHSEWLAGNSGPLRRWEQRVALDVELEGATWEACTRRALQLLDLVVHPAEGPTGGVDFDCRTRAGERLFFAEASCITLAVAARASGLPDSELPPGGSVGSLAHEVRERIIRKVPQAKRATDAPVVVVTGTLHRGASWICCGERLATEVVRGTDILMWRVGPNVRPEDQVLTAATDLAPSPFVVWDPVAQRLTWQANAVAGALILAYPFTQPCPRDAAVSRSCRLLLHPGAVRGFAGVPLPTVPTYMLRLHGDAGPVEAALLNPESTKR